jgi:type III restriction enzyme
MAIILDRDASRWFRPVKGQFQIFYKIGHDQQEYQPDFVGEAPDAIYMIETKAASAMGDAEVLAKRDAGANWCEHATDYALKHGGKPWRYLLIPHDVVAENMTLAGLADKYTYKP